MNVMVFWTGAWWPRYEFHRDMLDKPGRFYCSQLSWLFVRIFWHLNHGWP